MSTWCCHSRVQPNSATTLTSKVNSSTKDYERTPNFLYHNKHQILLHRFPLSNNLRVVLLAVVLKLRLTSTTASIGVSHATKRTRTPRHTYVYQIYRGKRTREVRSPCTLWHLWSHHGAGVLWPISAADVKVRLVTTLYRQIIYTCLLYTSDAADE